MTRDSDSGALYRMPEITTELDNSRCKTGESPSRTPQLAATLRR